LSNQEVAVNRTELIDAVSADTGLTRGQSEAALDAIVYQVTAGVRGGSPVRITGFGTFKLRERQARRGRNPQTGEAVRIKASKGIGFTPGVKLKADLNARGAIAKPRSLASKVAAKGGSAPARSASTASNGRRAATPAASKAAPARKTAATGARKASSTTTTAAAPARKTAAKKAPARR
jgi:DNA-binding protein HU-beta